MKYLFRCGGCGTERSALRSMADCSRPEPCRSCGGEATRIFSASFRVIGEMEKDKRENANPLGWDRSDALEFRRELEAEDQAESDRSVERAHNAPRKQTFESLGDMCYAMSEGKLDVAN